MSIKGGIEMRVDSTVMTADEADILFAAAGEHSDIQLRGNVRVRAIIR